MKLLATFMNKEQIIKEHLSEMGKKGGKKRWENFTTEQRQNLIKKMVDGRKKAVDKSTDQALDG